MAPLLAIAAVTTQELRKIMTETQRSLLQAARAAALKAYAPYSKFRVGAAVLAGGQVHVGANVENASYGLSLCAERVALAHAVVAGARDIEGLAVCCLDAPPAADPGLGMPCGACRQWISELAPEAWIVIDGAERVFEAAELLPLAFLLSARET